MYIRHQGHVVKEVYSRGQVQKHFTTQEEDTPEPLQT